MLRSAILLLLLALLAIKLPAQTTRHIVPWESSSISKSSAEEPHNVSDRIIRDYLWFNQANYLLPAAMLPYYVDLIPLPSWVQDNSQVNVRMQNPTYSPLTTEQLQLVSRYRDRIEEQEVEFNVLQSRGRSFLQANIPAIRINPLSGSIEKLTSFNLNVQPLSHVVRSKASQQTASQSVLAQGNWFKFPITQTGVHRISYAELESWGLTNLSNVSLWGHDGKQLPHINSAPNLNDLVQIPIWVDTGSDGSFGPGRYIYFFARGPLEWEYSEQDQMFTHRLHDYSETTHYFITTSRSNPLRLQNHPEVSGASTSVSTSYDALIHFERNDTNLIKSGRQWFGESFTFQPTRSFSTGFNKPVSGGTARVKVQTVVRSESSNSFTVRANGRTIGALTHSSVNVRDQYQEFGSLANGLFNLDFSDSSLDIELTFNSSSPAALAWLDYITVNARQQLSMGSGQLLFRDSRTVSANAIAEFRIGNAPSNLRVWDVTDFFSPRRMPLTVTDGRATFSGYTSELREYIAFNPSQALSVERASPIPNQNIHGASQPDMVIVAHPNFLSQANELASIHQSHSNLNCLVVSTEQVYNEYSSGTPDASAIRNMMRMFYNRSNGDESRMPRYLLLFGDGSYNNRSSRSSNSNFIPTYQSPMSVHVTESFVTDDFFGMLSLDEGGNTEALQRGLLDIGVGRIPCSTPEEASIVVRKIREYIGSFGSWHNQLCFIADDGDNNSHMFDSDVIADTVKANYPHYNVNKIYIDAYPRVSTAQGHQFPEANLAINNQANQGALVINYIGHANPRWLAHEKILLPSDILSWRNMDRLNLFVTATCEFSRFDDFGLQSAGEITLFAPRGGSVGLISTTRVVYASSNFVLNRNLFQTIFEERSDNHTNDQFYRLGDLVRIAKNRTGAGVNKLNFMLLGDPALMLHYPTMEMDITEINSTPVGQPLDTLRALSKVEVKGRIIDPGKNQPITGEAAIALFDKEVEVTTMGYESRPYTYKDRQSIIYRGRSTISNGEYSATFIIPKDIMYRYGSGRFSLYGVSGTRTGAGYFEDFTVGGIGDSIGNDSHGPEIEIFMNDKKFVPGGTTDPNPKLLIYLTDSSGINTTGAGIGHDLTATLINERQTTYILNDYYEAELDSYQKGKVEYQLANLPPGPQTIRVKAWDVYNNSSEAEIDFIVASSQKLTLSHILNYPNPFTQSTAFYFEHNQPYEDLDIIIQIFSPSGKLVKTIQHYEPAGPSYRIGPIAWDGLDDFGDRIGRGVYFYRLRVRASNGMNAQEYQKLVILK